MTSTEQGDEFAPDLAAPTAEPGKRGLIDRVGPGNKLVAAVSGAVAVAVMITATIALGATADDKPAAAKPGKAAASTTDRSYLTPVGTLLQNPALPRPALGGDTGTAGVPAGTKPRPTTPPVTPPADTGAIATYSGGSGTLTPAGIATLALQAGCSAEQAVTAVAVAIAESGGSPAAQGDVTLMDATWDWSAGLWQIRGLRDQRGTGQLRDSVANQKPAKNAAAMYAISSGCTSWTPWTTYTRGNYQSFLTIAQQAVGYVSNYKSKHGGQLPPVAAPDPNAPIPAGDGRGNAAAGTAAASTPVARKPAPRPTKARSSAAPATRAGGTGGTGGKGGGNGGGGGGGTSSSPDRATPAKSSSTPGGLPIKLPTKLPTTLPVPLPTLPKLPLPTLPPILGLH